MKNITLTQLTYIVAVNRFRNFSQAAKHCHVTQPTLSMQIHKAEDELGAILFDRSKQPVIPTLIGQEICVKAKEILQTAEDLDDILNQDDKELHGDFRLGIIPTLAPYLLPRFLPDFVSKYPRVSLHIEEMTTAQLIEKMHRDELDASILVTPLHEAGLKETPLFYEEIFAYLPAQSDLVSLKTLSADVLTKGNLMLLREGHCFRNQMRQICGNHNTNAMRSFQFESGSLETLKNLVDKNLGVTLLPAMAAEQMLTAAEKKRLKKFQGHPPVREISMVRARADKRKKIFRALMEEILEHKKNDVSLNAEGTHIVTP